MWKKNQQFQFVLLCFIAFATMANAQDNLLKNPNADLGAEHWKVYKQAIVETDGNGGRAFVVRGDGNFHQLVMLPDDAVGQYALLTGWAASDRTNSDGGITGLPYLYAYMMNGGTLSGGRINAYLQGQHMRSSATTPNEWVRLWGVFRVPAGTKSISLLLRQAMQRGEESNNSAARFRDLGVYLFPTEYAARAFIGDPALSAGSEQLATNDEQKPLCTLTPEQAPVTNGLRLGMTIEQALALFPGSSDDSQVQRARDPARVARFGFERLIIEPARYGVNAEHAGIKHYSLKFIDGRLYDLNVTFNGPQWNHVDEFITALSGEMGLPEAAAWHSTQGLDRFGKYLVCDDLEVRFFAAQPRSRNDNYISIIDHGIEKASTRSRRSAAKQLK